LVRTIPFSIIFILLLFCTPTASVYCAPDSCEIKTTYDHFFAPDKGRHLIGSFMMTVLGSKISQRRFNLAEQKSIQTAAVISFSIGLGKELRDSMKLRNHFSWKDMAANITGICLGVLVLGIK
jgi:putative lipoprotein